MINYTTLKHKQRKQAQDHTVREVLQQLLEISHKHIPNNSRVCRVTVSLDVPDQKRYLTLDFSPLHSTYVVKDPKLKLSLMQQDNT